MAINFNRYVDITSGVGGAPVISERELIARLFTTNAELPPKSYLEFTDAASVSAYFGSTSEEYKRAIFYFGFVGKLITKPRKISFARWVKEAAPAIIFGAASTTTLNQFKAVTTGSVSITVGAVTATVTGLDLSAATSLANVAALLQAAIRAASANQIYTTSTVTYDVAKSRFVFVAGLPATGTATLAITVTTGGTGVNLVPLLAWGSTALLSDGSDAETITDCLTDSDNQSDNFGSFAFLTETNALDVTQYLEAATWNKEKNVKYMLMIPVDASSAQPYQQALANVGGCALTLSLTANEYPEMLPMMILAATDYNRINATQNYMFYQAVLSASVETTIEANAYDALRVNYYGETQTAGRKLAFYQRGYMLGLPVDPLDMNTYANEIWLKDAAKTVLGNLLLALRELPANAEGRAKVLNQLQSVINQGLNSGVISVGKPLNSTQIAYVTDVTGDPDAYRQIENIGYFVDAFIEQEPSGDFVIKYVLVYSKDDVVRKIIGSHILI